MKDFKASKVVFKLPEKLEPNTSYWVRSGEGFDLYLSDVTGSVAYKPNVTSSQLADTLPIGKGGTGATDAATARGNLELGTAATRNVTTSSVDDTAGRLLKTGDFGFGGKKAIQYPYSYNTDIANSLSGWYGNTDVTTILFKSVDGNNAAQICMKVGGGATIDKSPWYIATNGTGRYGTQKWFLTSENTSYPKFDVSFLSTASGSSSYRKGWRKLTAILPSSAGETVIAHGVTTVETLQAKVTNTAGIIVYNNDIDPANQFYLRVNGAYIVLGVTAKSTKVFGKAATIYIGEEL